MQSAKLSLILSSIMMFAHSLPSLAEKLPTQPAQSEHPGSANYPFSVQRQTFSFSGRTVESFCPNLSDRTAQRVPTLVFGHGQALDLSTYNMTFEHLAKKGYCVIFPAYSSGFFDQDWRRMARDFVNLSAQALERLRNVADPTKILFAGHSKGGYVALVAAGLPSHQLVVKPASLVLFAPAGYDEDYIRTINPKLPTTVIYGESDSIIKRSLVDEIYRKLPSQYKQFILAKNYSMTEPQLPADHFFIANKKTLFGGRNGVSSLHFFGVWKWLGGGLQDLLGAELSNPYLYGSEADSTGTSSFRHEIIRN